MSLYVGDCVVCRFRWRNFIFISQKTETAQRLRLYTVSSSSTRKHKLPQARWVETTDSRLTISELKRVAASQLRLVSHTAVQCLWHVLSLQQSVFTFDTSARHVMGNQCRQSCKKRCLRKFCVVKQVEVRCRTKLRHQHPQFAQSTYKHLSIWVSLIFERLSTKNRLSPSVRKST